MTKADILDSIKKRAGVTKKESANILEIIFETIETILTTEGKLKISGFGNFVVNKKRTRRGRNPQTGDPIEIKARKILVFKGSPIIKKALNSPKLYATKKEPSFE
ncbi:MAG: integration host factor subunit alpha [bacterium]|nr:integration host factor subunit alpha [bacterium]